MHEGSYFSTYSTTLFYFSHLSVRVGSPVAYMVKNLPAMWVTWAQSLGWEDPIEKGMAREFHEQKSLSSYSP